MSAHPEFGPEGTTQDSTTQGSDQGSSRGRQQDRPRFFDDLAGIAGNAFSAFTGMRDEAESMVRARVDETLRRLNLVRREELDAVQDLAANARAGQEEALAALHALEARVAALEAARTAPTP